MKWYQVKHTTCFISFATNNVFNVLKSNNWICTPMSSMFYMWCVTALHSTLSTIRLWAIHSMPLFHRIVPQRHKCHILVEQKCKIETKFVTKYDFNQKCFFVGEKSTKMPMGHVSCRVSCQNFLVRSTICKTWRTWSCRVFFPFISPFISQNLSAPGGCWKDQVFNPRAYISWSSKIGPIFGFIYSQLSRRSTARGLVLVLW